MLRARQNGGGKLRNAGGRGNGNGSPGGRGNNGNSIGPGVSIAETSLTNFDGVNGSLDLYYDNGTPIAGTPYILWDTGVAVPGTLAYLSTAQKKFGTASVLCGGASPSPSVRYIATNRAPYLGVSTSGDVGCQMWVRPTSAAANLCFFFDCRNPSNTLAAALYQDATNMFLFFNGANRITMSALPLNTWSFVEWSRVAGMSRVFVDGTLVGAIADTQDYNNMCFRYGGSSAGSTSDPVYIDAARHYFVAGNTSSYIAPTQVFTSGSAATTSTWNSADKAATVTLIGDDRVAYTDTNFGAVRGTLASSSGKKQFEIITNQITTTIQILVGIGQAGSDLTNYPGAVATSYGYYSASGNKYNNNSGVAYGTAWGTLGIVIGVVYDATLGTLTFYRDGVSQGTAFTGLSGAYYPMWGSGNNTAVVRSAMINTGQYAFAFPVAGATAWG